MVAPSQGRAARGRQLQRHGRQRHRVTGQGTAATVRGAAGATRTMIAGIGCGVMWPGNIVLGAAVGAGHVRMTRRHGRSGDIRRDGLDRHGERSQVPPGQHHGQQQREALTQVHVERGSAPRTVAAGSMHDFRILGPARRRHKSLRPG